MFAWLRSIFTEPPSPQETPKPVQPVSDLPSIALLKQLENCKLQAYQDGAGIWTIGYGHTANVKKGMTCTQEQAEQWLADDATVAWDIVKQAVKVPLTSYQAAALMTFVYNVGGSAFRNSTLLKKLNTGDYDTVPNELMGWVYITVNGKKTISKGLVNRREAELHLFTNFDWRIA